MLASPSIPILMSMNKFEIHDHNFGVIGHKYQS